jgi:hypothetical protein
MAKKSISAKVVAGIREEILKQSRMELPVELIREVIEQEPELRWELVAADGELDTEVRELFLETLAQHLAGTSWPLIGDPRERSGRALKSIRRAVKARGGRIHPPPPVTELSFAVEILADGIRSVVPRGRIDQTNYTHFPESLLRALAGKKGTWSGYRLILDFRAVEWAGVDQALYALTTSAQNIRFYKGALVAIGVSKPLLARLEELRSKMAAETIPTLAGSAEEALRLLRGSG